MEHRYPLITEDGTNHGVYTVEDCIEAVVMRCEDGYVHCPMIWSGGTCEECLKTARERRKHDRCKIVGAKMRGEEE